MDRSTAPHRGGTVWRFLLVLPSLTFVAVNLLKFELGVDAPYDALEPLIGPSHPVVEILIGIVVVLGPIGAVLLTLRRTASMSVSRASGGLEARASLRARWPDLAVVVLALAVLAAIALYLVAENL